MGGEVLQCPTSCDLLDSARRPMSLSVHLQHPRFIAGGVVVIGLAIPFRKTLTFLCHGSSLAPAVLRAFPLSVELGTPRQNSYPVGAFLWKNAKPLHLGVAFLVVRLAVKHHVKRSVVTLVMRAAIISPASQPLTRRMLKRPFTNSPSHSVVTLHPSRIFPSTL